MKAELFDIPKQQACFDVLGASVYATVDQFPMGVTTKRITSHISSGEWSRLFSADDVAKMMGCYRTRAANLSRVVDRALARSLKLGRVERFKRGGGKSWYYRATATVPDGEHYAPPVDENCDCGSLSEEEGHSEGCNVYERNTPQRAAYTPEQVADAQAKQLADLKKQLTDLDALSFN